MEDKEEIKDVVVKDKSPKETVATSEKKDGDQVSRNKRSSLVGVVKSDKMSKTISVDVVSRIAHKTYKKIVKRTTRLYAHDEKEEAKEGDKVLIMQTRPLSKLKNWRLVKVLKH